MHMRSDARAGTGAIYERAQEPKTLKLVPEADHRFTGFGDELFKTVSDWLIEKI